MASLSILVVYHDESHLERIRAALTPVGYEVVPAGSAGAAVAELERQSPRVVVIAPGVAPEIEDEITAAVRRLHPKLSVLRLSPNHINRISELLQ